MTLERVVLERVVLERVVLWEKGEGSLGVRRYLGVQRYVLFTINLFSFNQEY
tara:strand:- start:617 stop:772 length:156 start_codon:yes stop_codon:yes gene_type:complete